MESRVVYRSLYRAGAGDDATHWFLESITLSSRVSPAASAKNSEGYCDGCGNRLDLLIGLRGMEAGAFTRIPEIPFQAQKLRFIGREDFIAMKAFAGGPMDVVDATRAIAAAGGSLDKALLLRLGKHRSRRPIRVERLQTSARIELSRCGPEWAIDLGDPHIDQ